MTPETTNPCVDPASIPQPTPTQLAKLWAPCIMELAPNSRREISVHKRFPLTLSFLAGIMIGAATNILTSLEREQLWWRVAAMVTFLLSGILLFCAANRAEVALNRARYIAAGNEDELPREAIIEFGRRGFLQLGAAFVTTLAAVLLLFFGALFQS